MRISIIIPTLNEEENIGRTLKALMRERPFEIIVVDANSTDNTVQIARKYARVIRSSKGRARQMNAGARIARGDLLLFLHSDTILPRGALKLIPEDAEVAAFRIRFDLDHWLLRATAWWSNNIRLRRGIVFGDHAFAIRKSLFEKLGGFKNLCILEDLEFSKRLRKRAKVRIIDAKVMTSSRRYVKRGVLKQWLINQYVKLLYFLGFDCKTIRSVYEKL
ncbi:glycosyltransferase [Candidatus Woesearchaeota archaeon]|nr:MAG: glycosyltransferase [Candidatus Woesearchaeota archaeon]